MLKRLLVVALVGLWSGVALGADGDAFATNQGSSYGPIKIIKSIYLCDTKGAASTTCTTVDLRDSPGQTTALILERNAETGCSGNSTATFSTAATASGTKHTLGANSSIDDDPTRLVVDLRTAPLDRYLLTDLSTMTDCTDFEVLLHWVEEKTSP